MAWRYWYGPICKTYAVSALGRRCPRQRHIGALDPFTGSGADVVEEVLL